MEDSRVIYSFHPALNQEAVNEVIRVLRKLGFLLAVKQRRKEGDERNESIEIALPKDLPKSDIISLGGLIGRLEGKFIPYE